jgi:hypothetical protein
MISSAQLKKHWPLIAALGILWITAALLLIPSLVLNGGHLIYALDDSYIHMAIAKNIAQHGVWGVTRYEFTSSSSSLLWTLLLSATYYVFGVRDSVPFLWNLLFATLLILESYLLLKRYSLKPAIIFIALAAIIFFTPVPLLLFYGLEHILHALCTIAFVYLSAKILSSKRPSSGDFGAAMFSGILVATARYEGLFLIFVVCVFLLLRKRMRHSFLLGGIAAAPVTAYGLYSMANGWYFFPNSILLKGNIPECSIAGLSRFAYQFFASIVNNPHVLVLLAAASLLLALRLGKARTFWEPSSITLAIFLAVSFLHLMFSASGLFSRYDAYLVALGVLVLAVGLHELKSDESMGAWNRHSLPGRAATVLFFTILASPLLGRAFVSLKKPVRATANIFEQQYQMGSFLRQFYQGKAVAVNDIGVINYLAEVHCLDLCGLASMDVAKSRRAGEYTTQRMFDLAQRKHVVLAMVYDSWFQGKDAIPPSWVKVGEWILTNNIICGGDTVSIYAVDPLVKGDLMRDLRAFSSSLPGDDVQSGLYLK